jgi:hypothetical protein
MANKNGKWYCQPNAETIKAIEQVPKETMPEQLSEFDHCIKGSVFLRKQMCDTPYRK